MKQPYRYMKSLVKVGNGFYVIVPNAWLRKAVGIAKRSKNKRSIIKVIIEEYEDKLVITPDRSKTK